MSIRISPNPMTMSPATPALVMATGLEKGGASAAGGCARAVGVCAKATEEPRSRSEKAGLGSRKETKKSVAPAAIEVPILSEVREGSAAYLSTVQVGAGSAAAPLCVVQLGASSAAAHVCTAVLLRARGVAHVFTV